MLEFGERLLAAHNQRNGRGSPSLSSADSRCAKLRCSQELFECRKLPDSLRGCNRAFTIQFVVSEIFDIVFALLSLKPRGVYAYLFWRKHSPHFGSKSRQLSGEFGMPGGGARKIDKLFTDDIVAALSP
jgi:hypothetical protein